MKTTSTLAGALAALLVAGGTAHAGGYGAPYAVPGYDMHGPHGMPGPYGAPGPYGMRGPYPMPAHPSAYGQQGYGKPHHGQSSHGKPRQRHGSYGTASAGTQQAYGTQSYGSPRPAEPERSGKAGDTATGGSGEVTVSGMQYQPAVIEVSRGDTVTWRFRDAVPHTVTGRGGDFSSDRMTAGGSFQHTFSEAGEFDYYCAVHPNMRGKVIVK